MWIKLTVEDVQLLFKKPLRCRSLQAASCVVELRGFSSEAKKDKQNKDYINNKLSEI